jgi:arylformamidase
LFDLTPLSHTSINVALRMDEAEAQALSPLFWPGPEGKTLDAVVGQFESEAFVVQSQCIVADWEGVNTLYDVVPDANHFTVIAPLVDPSSAMCERLKQLVDAAG